VSDLFVRTVSQGLQAFLPVGFGLAALRRRGRGDAVSGIAWGLSLAVPATIAANAFFRQTPRPSFWEATLALIGAAAVTLAIRASRVGRPAAATFAGVTALLVARQALEINASLVAAWQLGLQDALTGIVAATLLAIGVTVGWICLAPRLNVRGETAATRTFVMLFLCQLAMYAFHEYAEARVLPWSEVLHAATEPYGPDGQYGRYFAWLLIVAPLMAAAGTTVTFRLPARAVAATGAYARSAAVVCLVFVAIGGGLSLRSSTPVTPTAAPADVAKLGDGPHLLFRHTLVDGNYNRLSMVSLSNPGGQRLAIGPPCERVAFAGGRGICLQAARGVFTTYKAVLLDRTFKTLAEWRLDGGPSRTRVAADGRVGAITVFVSGHAYGTSPFSTKTTLIDMASGETLGDLEQFAVWRDGARFKAADFNFWGVTFTRDSNSFYATLATGGKTFLVKGDLGLRKLTVVYEGVECPSLSPDGRLIAFKKRVNASTGFWRAYILELAAMREHPVAGETRNIDDQMEWLDNSHILYALPREASAITDVWSAAVDGTAPASIFVPGAESPAVVR
jgi:hypothetical protein